MGYLTDHAKEEFRLSGWTDSEGNFKDEMQEHLCTGVLDLLSVLEKQNHSGTSIQYALPLFARLAEKRSLSPLNSIENNPNEWVDVSENGQEFYQNRRCSTVFKDKNGYFDINAKVLWHWVLNEETGRLDKDYFSGPESVVYVEMPYTSPTEPVYEFYPTPEYPFEEMMQ